MPTDPPIDSRPPPASSWVSNRFVRVVIRAVRTWIQTFVGVIFLVNVGQEVGGYQFLDPSSAGDALKLSAYIALWPTGISFLQNIAEELAKLDPGTALRG